jgi:hypothetical protein
MARIPGGFYFGNRKRIPLRKCVLRIARRITGGSTVRCLRSPNAIRAGDRTALPMSGLGRVKIGNRLPRFGHRAFFATPTKGWIAQLVEQRTENPRVAGSIPAPATPLFLRVSGGSRKNGASIPRCWFERVRAIQGEGRTNHQRACEGKHSVATAIERANLQVFA